ncbi:hypothetical protein FJY68_02360 [candidate division WOR-3 bacterium]|uniref:Uncharacterized protein n=1 Tax=candidate division WOR-3 bacterium TaxID=2052148 RepID=A0A937XBL5_UNCW3|nr:hypothetical protein [candidate division WOR-3 bacterium]
MKTDGNDWLDWLHRIREESEAERRRQGKTIAEWLARAEETADRVEREIAATASPVARDNPPKDSQP